MQEIAGSIALPGCSYSSVVRESGCSLPLKSSPRLSGVQGLIELLKQNDVVRAVAVMGAFLGLDMP
jgi:hypothetical protein